ncbi:hypothetical protein C2G38_2217702 [Gigaspora rosea]|uniref:Uncharacterized protein n=1 Tax=Gigaspora rosea TaxID=44941 RepID=A0A397U7M9_9GLOM|nr:hypothetical protein C2G38_2217702 [Gigaspora rosea]
MKVIGKTKEIAKVKTLENKEAKIIANCKEKENEMKVIAKAANFSQVEGNYLTSNVTANVSH